MRRKTCIVWNYFTSISAKDAFCNVCGRNIRYHRSNTNLRSHLRVWHRDIWCEISNEMKSQLSDCNNSNDNEATFQTNLHSMLSHTTIPTGADQLDPNSLTFSNLSQEENHEQQQQQLFPQIHSSIQTKPMLGKSTSLSSDISKDIYIVPNTAPSVSDCLLTENVSPLNIPQFHEEPAEEVGEADRTQDSGVISIDECDIVESKDAVAAQIELLQPSSHLTNNGNCEESGNSNKNSVNNSIVIDDLESPEVPPSTDVSRKENTVNKSTIDETDSIAEYFKICDNSTRQTFLDVMRNDRQQHALAVDSMSSELKSVSKMLQEVREKQQKKKCRLEQLLHEINQVQEDCTLLEDRNYELTEREAQLQDKLKQFNKKVLLCDSALNAVTNGTVTQTSVT
ncbi:uncharacterized protein LOC115214149 [Argonauta hians]